MRPMRAGEGDGEGVLPGMLRFLETLPLELPTPEMLGPDGDIREAETRPVERDVEVVPRWGVVFR